MASDWLAGQLIRWRPDAIVDRVELIDTEALRRAGIQAVLLDIDNTIARWQCEAVAEPVRAWLQALEQAGISVCLVSNSLWSQRPVRMAAQLGVDYVPHAGKPRRRGLRQALQQLNVSPENAVIIGDQLFTDIWGGKRMRMRAILVRRVHRREFIGTYLHRLLESAVLWMLRRRNMLPGTEGMARPSNEPDR